MKSDLNRRQFLGTAAKSLVLVAGGGLIAVPALAAEKLSPSDPTAAALHYTEDASKVDAAKVPTFKAGSHCANCVLYQAASAKGGFAPCGAFAGKLVAHGGWCSAWTAKT